jgi:hypothetical protein
MNKEKIRKYLESRYNADKILNLDEETFDKILFTAYSLLSTYYSIKDVEEDIISPIIAEQSIFMSKYDIDFDAYYEYSGLSTFDIGSAVKGTVRETKNDLISPIVLAMLEKEGIVNLVSTGRVKNHYTYL